MNNFQMLRERSRDFNIELDDNKIKQFREYLRLLDEFNRHTNIVSSTEMETVTVKHFLDSLALGLAAKELNFNSKLKLIDIGTGGGFPGIPLVIAFPEWKLCAVDSIAKKLKFIELLTQTLGISDRVEVVSARAEELGRNHSKREFYNLAVTRAVAKLNIISEYCLPLVNQQGYFIAYKAKLADDELEESSRAISILGGEYVNTVKYTLTGEEERNLILIKKVSPTPEKYPRRTGVPLKKPL